MSRLCAVVVNHRTPEATIVCVGKMLKSTRVPDTIVVVDNGSGDGSAEALRVALPGVDHLPLERNLGFAGGSNEGMRRALATGAERLLLVNSDAEVEPDAIARLERALDRDPRLGIVGPTIVDARCGRRIESRGIYYSLRTARVLNLEAEHEIEAHPPDQVRLVEGVSGCVMMIARHVLERHGLFDEEYFYSFEDLDLCLRAASGGWRSACVTAAIVKHDRSLTIGRKSPRRVYFAMRNHLRLSLATGAPTTALLRQAYVLGLNVLHVLVRAPAPTRAQGLLALGRGVRDHLLRRYGHER